ncbi:MAG: pyridoxal-phosphate dependent enzyme [Sandaracinaceae bacterium]|nr:pyridoxal-phosphate dependent enzyme [Sandaracinaceae bacterium]
MLDPAMGRRAALRALAGLGAAAIAPRAIAQREARPLRQLLARFQRVSLPWRDLGGLPTPVSRVEVGGAPLWIKHDERAGAVYGGSKARKLELFLGEAIARGGARPHLRRGRVEPRARHGARGARGGARVRARAPARAAERARARAPALGGGPRRRAPRGDAPRSGGAPRAVERVGGARPYVIPLGGTSALGNVGYVEAALELAAQIEAGLLPRPARIYVAAGTSGAAAGLYVGLAAAGLPIELRAVRVSSRASVNAPRLRREIEATAALLRAHDPAFPPIAIGGALSIDDRAVGPGYARPSEEGARAAAVAAELGLELDPTYTAKAFAAVLRDRPRGEVLFWSTYDPRRLATNATVADLPPAFRRYFGR